MALLNNLSLENLEVKDGILILSVFDNHCNLKTISTPLISAVERSTLTYTVEGDGKSKVIKFPHFLDVEPGAIFIQAASRDAGGFTHVESDKTYVYVYYDFAPRGILRYNGIVDNIYFGSGGGGGGIDLPNGLVGQFIGHEKQWEYPSSDFIKGGFHSVNDVEERDAIPSVLLLEGMLVNVLSEGIIYEYVNGEWSFFATSDNGFKTVGLNNGFLDVYPGGMRKVVANRDIQIRHEVTRAGANGTILVQQDAQGSRNVYLQTGDLGKLTINPIPNGVTRLDWVSDGVTMFWTSTILDLTEEILDPQPINNLRVVIVDVNSVKLEWTAKSGNGIRSDVPASRYAIYYSQAPINQSNFEKATRYVPQVTPKLPGELESATVPSLKAESSYYFVVVPETTFFTLRRANISNVVQARTKSSILPAGTSSRIKIGDKQIYMFMHPYKLGPNNEALTEGNLAEPNVAYENGAPVGPPDGKIMSLQYYITMDWEQYKPVQIVIDIERVVRLDYIHFWRDLTPVTKIFTSLNGADWVYANTMQNDYPVSSKNWYKYDIPNNAKQCRYVKLELIIIGSFDADGIVLSGSELSVTAVPNGKRLKLIPERMRFEYAHGTNSFLNEDPHDYGQFGKHIRFYNNWDWMVSTADQAVGKKYTLDRTNPIRYQYSTSRLWNFDEKLKEVHDLGLIAIWSHQNIPEFLLDDADRNEGWRLKFWGIDTAQIPTATNKEDPMSWRIVAQYFFNTAARYGGNANIDDSLLRLHPDEPVKKGLGYLKYLEYYNEPDAIWHTQKGFYSPFMMAAYMSACYDGHKGALGPGFGAKNADPNMLMVFPGLADNNLGYLRFMMNWWDTYRGPGDYPFDVYNWHLYSNTRRGQTTKNELPEEGIAPEPGEFQEICEEVSLFRKMWFPEKMIALTEFGYDEHPKSPQGAKQIGDRVIGLVKADWLMRSFFISVMCEVDFNTQFMYRGADSYLAEITASGYSSKFTTSGYVDYVGSPGDRYHDKDGNPIDPRQASYYYIGALIKEMEGMIFSHIIKDKFQIHVEDILVNSDADVYAVAFVPATGVVKSPCIALWLSSSSEKTATVQIKTDAVSTVKVSTYRDIEKLKTLVTPTSQVATSVVNSEYRVVQLELTETPILLWTTKVGKPKIKTPTNLDVTSLSGDSLRLTWWDDNAADYKTEIYMAIEANAELVKIADDFFPECGYTVGGLTPGVSRWFAIRLVSIDGTRTSEFSYLVAGTTNQSIQEPTNFRVLSRNVNKLNLGWDFIGDTDKISGFEIYKSPTATGTYVLYSTFGKNANSFQDVGLVQDTTYYYKLRTIAPNGNSVMTGVLAATTSEAQALPPEVLNKNTTYFGDKVFVWFDLPVKDYANAENNFTVYEVGAITPIKTITGFELDQDGQRLAILLSTPIEKGDSTVYVGYDGNANLASIYDVKVESFEDSPVMNFKGNQSLVANKISLSFNGWNNEEYGVEYSPIGTDNFNEIPTGAAKYDLGANYVVTQLESLNGNITTIDALMPMVQGSGVTYKTDAQLQPSYTPMLTLANFPSKVAAKGLNNGYTFNIQRLVFLNLNPANRYNVQALISAGNYITQPVYGKGTINEVSSSSQTVLATGNDGSRIMSWENIKPVTMNVPIGANNVPSKLNTPKLVVDITATENGKTFVACGLYLEEIIEYMPAL